MSGLTAQRSNHQRTLAVLSLGAVAYSLLQSLVLPALPDIQHSLHASETTVSWVLTAYLLSASIATPIVGRLGDIHGKERVLVIVLVLLALGTLVSGIATSMTMLLVGRVIQGIGGGMFPLAFGIIRDEFPPREVAGGIGVLSSIIGIGAGAGVLLAGFVVEHLSYHWLFWFPLVATVIAAVAAYVFVPESPVKAPARINWLAAALLSAGLATVLIGVSKTTTWGWGSPKTIAVITAGLVLLAAWVAVESRARDPLVDMRTMRVRGVWTTNLVAFLVGVGMYSGFFLIPQFVQEPTSTGYGFGVSVIAGGLFLLPATIAMLLVGQGAGAVERRFGSRLALIGGCAVLVASFVLLTVARDQRWEVYLASALLGLGTGLAFAAMPNLIVQNVGREETGVATGVNTVMRTLGGALGGQITATFIASNLGTGGLPTDHGYGLAFGVCSGALVVAVLTGLAIPGGRRSAPGVIGARAAPRGAGA